MLSKNILKNILVANETFILKKIDRILSREGICIPEELNKVVVLYGVRRSGKTFILYDFFKKYADCALYVDFEDERLTGFDVQDFERLKDAFLELKPELIGRKLVFLLDEIQNVKDWEKFCRRAVERENIKIYVTGSSSQMMPFEIQTELRGRAWSLEVWPFSFREYLRAKGMDAGGASSFHGQDRVLVKGLFSDYLRWGGFPEVFMLSAEFEKKKLLDEYLSAMFFRDLVERNRITNITLLDHLTNKLFSGFSAKFSLTAFYKQYRDRFPFSKDLLFRYYKNFMENMLVFELRKFVESVYKRMRNPAKIYLVDTGLCKRVTSADSGRLLENCVFLELKRRGYDLYYFEGKRECDFIAKDPDDRLYPVQVCFDLHDANKDREIGGLMDACKSVQVDTALMLTEDHEEELTAEGINIRIVPAWRWCIEKS